MDRNISRVIFPDIYTDEIFSEIPEYNSLWCLIKTRYSENLVQTIIESKLIEISFMKDTLAIDIRATNERYISHIESMPSNIKYCSLLIEDSLSTLHEIELLPIL